MARIIASHISLAYPIYNIHAKSLRSHLISFTSGGVATQKSPRVIVVEALRGIDLRLEDGDRLGLIGPNGAGKSSLLKVLAGLYAPTEGHIERTGRTTTLFDLSLGMDHDATGYENIRLAAYLRGIAPSDIERFIVDVAVFSELEDFLQMPIRTYSAGMLARLGFSIATTTDPEILLIDEVLGAGDQYFVKKALQRIEEIARRSHVLVLASHSTEMIRAFCNKCALMQRGRIVEYGSCDDVLEKYALS